MRVKYIGPSRPGTPNGTVLSVSEAEGANLLKTKLWEVLKDAPKANKQYTKTIQYKSK